MTGGEYLFNLMAKSFGAKGQPYHLQPIQVREVMENAYQDIRLKMFGAEGKEWAANALAPGNVEYQNLRELNQRLKDENRRLTEAKEELEVAVENRTGRPAALLLNPRPTVPSSVVEKQAVAEPIRLTPKESTASVLDRRETPLSEKKLGRLMRFRAYMRGRAFE